MERRQNRGLSTAAGLLLGLQAAFALLSALVLFASARRLHRWTLATSVAHHRTVLGLAMLVVAGVVLVLAVGVISGAAWARIGAFVFEALSIVGAVFRVGAHPVPSVLSVALAMVVIVLLAGAGEDAAPAQREHEPTSRAGTPGAA